MYLDVSLMTSWDKILKFSAVDSVIMRRRFLYLIIFEVWTRFPFSLSLWPWKMNLALHRSVGVQGF